MDERAFYKESQTPKPLTLNCPFCRGSDSYDLRWVVRTKIASLPAHADERDRATFKKAASYMFLMYEKVMCKTRRCGRRVDEAVDRTMPFLQSSAGSWWSCSFS